MSPPPWTSLPRLPPQPHTQRPRLRSRFYKYLLTSPLFYIRMCICFNITLSILPTLSFPYCVHKSVLYGCVSFPAPQINSSVPFSYIPNTCVYVDVCFSLLTYFTLKQAASLALTQICSFLCWVIFHCMCVPQLLYPFICRGASRLLPCTGYCK